MDVYEEEMCPDYIKYVINTYENREKLIMLCKDIFDIYLTDNILYCKYIEINFIMKYVSLSPDFNWLYRNTPPLITIEELIINLILNKIKKIKDKI